MGASLAARVRHTGKAANNRSAGATPSTLVASPKRRPHGAGVPRADRCSHRDEVVEEGARQAVGCVAAEARDGVPGQVDRAVLDVHLQGEGRWEWSSWGYTTAGSGHALPGLAGQAAWARTSECSSACRDASDPPLPRLGTSFAGTSRTWRQQVEGGRWAGDAARRAPVPGQAQAFVCLHLMQAARACISLGANQHTGHHRLAASQGRPACRYPPWFHPVLAGQAAAQTFPRVLACVCGPHARPAQSAR